MARTVSGGLDITISVKVSSDELLGWTADRVTKLMGGIAAVQEAVGVVPADNGKGAGKRAGGRRKAGTHRATPNPVPGLAIAPGAAEGRAGTVNGAATDDSDA